jgi:pyridoxal 5'-phosphate synthase pdxS subunit
MKESDISKLRFGTTMLKKGFAKMQKGGVVMDVTNADQAKIAEDNGAVAVMALERVPADIRADGGVARMADPAVIQEIMDEVSIPVMAKVRIGHFVEAQALESLGVTGNIIEAIRHQRMVTGMIRTLKNMDKTDLHKLAEEYTQSYVNSIKTLTNQKIEKNTIVFEEYRYDNVLKEVVDILKEIKELQRLPVVNFAAGGIATPADAAIMMQLGSDGVFVGSGIFKSDNPKERAKAIVEAVSHYDEPDIIAKISKNLGEAMPGIEIGTIPPEQMLQERGW